MRLSVSTMRITTMYVVRTNGIVRFGSFVSRHGFRDSDWCGAQGAMEVAEFAFLKGVWSLKTLRPSRAMELADVAVLKGLWSSRTLRSSKGYVARGRCGP